MLKNQLIIMPIDESWDHSADFLRQTALTLSSQNQVIIYDQKNAYFFLKKKERLVYPKHKNIEFHQVKYFLPFRRFLFLEKLNRLFSFWFLLYQHRFSKKIVWIFYPNYYDLAKIKNRSIINLYDCVDYCEDFDKEIKLIKNVNYFFVNSLALQKLHQNKNKEAIYIDAQGFFLPDEKKVKEAKLKKNKPIIGFVGGINYRLDFVLLNQLIKNNPQWHFVFYGPKQKFLKEDILFRTEFWLKKIKKYQNVTFGKSKNRYEVYGLIKKIDVAIIPYNPKITFNKYCYPMKVFEYLYFQKPVVSSDIKELNSDKFKKLVKIAKKYKDWNKNIQDFLNNNHSSTDAQQGQKLAISNSWQQKINKIMKIIDHY